MLAVKQREHRLGLGLDRARRRFLHQNIAGNAVFKREQHQIDRLFQAHHETGHGRVGDRDGLPLGDLIDPQGDDGAAAAQHVAVPRTADVRRFGRSAFRHQYFLHHRLGRPHGVHGVGRLIGGQADHVLHAFLNGGGQHVFRSDDVGLHRFHREKLAGRHLFQGRGVKHKIHVIDGVADGGGIPHVPDEETELFGRLRHTDLQIVPHIVLFQLIAGKNPDFPDVRFQEPVEHRVSERSGSAGDEKRFSAEALHAIALPFAYVHGLAVVFHSRCAARGQPGFICRALPGACPCRQASAAAWSFSSIRSARNRPAARPARTPHIFPASV